MKCNFWEKLATITQSLILEISKVGRYFFCNVASLQISLNLEVILCHLTFWWKRLHCKYWNIYYSNSEEVCTTTFCSTGKIDTLLSFSNIENRNARAIYTNDSKPDCVRRAAVIPYRILHLTSLDFIFWFFHCSKMWPCFGAIQTQGSSWRECAHRC